MWERGVREGGREEEVRERESLLRHLVFYLSNYIFEQFIFLPRVSSFYHGVIIILERERASAHIVPLSRR